MGTRGSLFENKRYSATLNDTVQLQFVRFLGEVIYEAVCACSGDKRFQQFLASAMSKKTAAGYPYIDRERIYTGCDEKEISTLYKALNHAVKNGKNEGRIEKWAPSSLRSVDEEGINYILDVRMDNMTAQGRAEYCEDLLTHGIDLSAALNLIQYAGEIDKPEGYAECIRKICPDDEHLLADCRNIRNKYVGHKDDIAVAAFDKQRFIYSINKFKLTAEACRCSSEEAQYQRKTFLDIVDKEIKKAGMRPLPIKELEETLSQYGFNNDAFLNSKYRSDIDMDEGILYWHSLEEVKEYQKENQIRVNALLYEKLGDLLNISSVSTRPGETGDDREPHDAAVIRREISSEKQDGTERGAVIAEGSDDGNDGGSKELSSEHAGKADEAGGKKLIRELMPAMSGCRRYVNQEQLGELIENTTFMADEAFWMHMAEMKQIRFIMDTLREKLDGAGRKMAVDWTTRAEIVVKEINTGNRLSAEQVKSAKIVHNAMRMMHEKKFLAYLEKDTEYASSEESIIALACSNPDYLFTVLTAGNSLIDEINKRDIRNIIPLSYLIGDRLIIKRQALPVLRSLMNAFIDDDGLHFDDRAEAEDEPADQERGAYPAAKQDYGEAAVTEYVRTAAKVQGTADRHTEADDKKTGAEYEPPEKDLPDDRYIPGEGDEVYTKDGTKVKLSDVIGEGGEGSVYQTDVSGKAAKIYLSEKLTVSRLKKLMYMVENNPDIGQLCWPEQLLYNSRGEFAGYLMRDVSGYEEFGRSVFKLNSKSVVQARMSGWDRKPLVKLCLEICRVFLNMNRHGILMGDINPRNMMLKLTQDGYDALAFVDCDSYQAGNYPCPVGTEVFTSPRIYKKYGNGSGSIQYDTFLREKGDEEYALASLLFQLLMLGSLPFAGKGGTDIVDSIVNYKFAYRISGTENTGKDTPYGPNYLMWNNIPNYIKIKFGDVFMNGRTVAAEEWINVLKRYFGDLQRKVFTSELIPNRYWDSKNRDYTVDIVCTHAGCGCKTNMPRSTYYKYRKNNWPILCNMHNNIWMQMRQNPIEKTCSYCHRSYTYSEWDEYADEWRVNNLDWNWPKPYCEECSKKINCTCDICGAGFERKKGEVGELRAKNKPVMCPQCRMSRHAR